jgi:hypothetical protein
VGSASGSGSVRVSSSRPLSTVLPAMKAGTEVLAAPADEGGRGDAEAAGYLMGVEEDVGLGFGVCVLLHARRMKHARGARNGQPMILVCQGEGQRR